METVTEALGFASPVVRVIVGTLFFGYVAFAIAMFVAAVFALVRKRIQVSEAVLLGFLFYLLPALMLVFVTRSVEGLFDVLVYASQESAEAEDIMLEWLGRLATDTREDWQRAADGGDNSAETDVNFVTATPVPAPDPTQAAVSTLPPPSPSALPSAMQYTVRTNAEGYTETLIDVAAKFSVDVEELKRLNGRQNVELLRGEVILIPITALIVPTATPSPTQAPTIEPTIDPAQWNPQTPAPTPVPGNARQ